jgi:hypothetical protein
MKMANALDFLNNWISENINAEAYDPPKGVIEEYAERCIAEAEAGGFTRVQIEDAAGGNLTGHIAAEMEAATDREVKRLADKDD